MIKTYTRQGRQPYSYSDLPAPAPTQEPIVEVGDLVTVESGMAHAAYADARVTDVSEDGGLIWLNVPGDHRVVGVHRVTSITRGLDKWVRS